ncbi:MAG: cupin-like domain-containing protein [Chitinophagales bacterium]
MRKIPIKIHHWLLYNTLFFVEHFMGRKLFLKYFGRVENWLVKQVQSYPDSYFKSDFKVIEVEKGTYTNPYIDKNYPVVFRGAALDWECCKEWNLDFFAQEYGDYEVTMQDNIGVTDRDHPQTFSQMKMSEYIKELRSGSKKYLKFSRVIKDPKILSNYFKSDWLAKFKRHLAFGNTYYFFIGGKDTKTPIHDGYACTVFIQVEGQKKWTFYDTKDRFFLNVRPERRNYYYSNANPYNLDDPNFPLLKYAQRRELILNPGDILWFPPLVYHQVENVNDSIGVAYKFVDIPLSFYSSKIQAALFYLSTRPTIFTMFFGNRMNENDYIFSKDKKEFKYTATS